MTYLFRSAIPGPTEMMTKMEYNRVKVKCQSTLFWEKAINFIGVDLMTSNPIFYSS
jgi:hypothetical protein